MIYNKTSENQYSEQEETDQVAMVKVVGMDVDEAKLTIINLGLHPEVQFEESTIYDSGTVLKANVQDGVMVDKNSTVIITVAQNESDEGKYQEENKDESEKSEKIVYEDIFYYTLIDNIEAYNGKYVRTSFEVSYCKNDDDEKYIESEYPELDDVERYANIIVYPDNFTPFKSGEYITVEGRVAYKEYRGDVLVNANIVNSGEEAKQLYEKAKNAYDEEKRVLAEEYEKDFKENSASPTYDDLLRYPDSYKEIQIKINAKIVKVEPDGIIFDGDIEATMVGETIALYDGREMKEPKLREGDSVTIYGYGKGTTTVKVQDVSGLIPKTVDKYSIPAIDIRYIEFN